MAPPIAKPVLEHPTGDLADSYSLGAVLGTGHFGVVRACRSLATGEALACKSVEKRRLRKKSDLEELRREVEIMRRLGAHPNVVCLVDVFEDATSVHIVQELCAGGELFDAITARRHYPEAEAAHIFREIVSAVAHCHAHGVMHRDLKPENLLLAAAATGPKEAGRPAAAPRIKLCDFGLALNLGGEEQWEGMAGSPFYMAPEVILGRYGREADMWSLGVVLYILLCGVPPFWGESDRRTFQAVVRGHVGFAEPAWKGVSAEAKCLVRGLLSFDASRRPTADRLLSHSWLRKHAAMAPPPPPPPPAAAPAPASLSPRSLLACFFPVASRDQSPAAACNGRPAAAGAAARADASLGRALFEPALAARSGTAAAELAPVAEEDGATVAQAPEAAACTRPAGVAQEEVVYRRDAAHGSRGGGDLDSASELVSTSNSRSSSSSSSSRSRSAGSLSWSLSPRGPLDLTSPGPEEGWWFQNPAKAV